MSDLEKIIDALDRLMKMFMVERYVYLALTASAFLIVLVVGYQIVFEKNASEQTPMLATIFGGSGLITIAAGRMTMFFNKAFSLIDRVVGSAGNGQ